ncbi:hypothetical protein OHS70_05155 [Streptomyces sp. NBC_00390]|uniref:hypothetical protein n=1 Tax=Streptomyces sp. NBC_00390 TaxID=2975736 RepID=UPI002E1F199B
MTDETEPQPTQSAVSAEEEAKALRDLLDEDAEPDEDRPLGILKGRYQPTDRRASPPAPPDPPAPPTLPPAE